MKYALLSDIHANLPALQSMLERADQAGAQRHLCLGDVVGYGAQPNECCEIVQELGAQVVRGNHDAAAVRPGLEQWFTPGAQACILWTREVLSTESRAFLESLPPLAEAEGAVLCHGSVPDPDLYTLSPEDALHSLEVLDGPLAFFGHTHLAGWFERPAAEGLPQEHPAPEGCCWTLQEQRQYLVNPGSVGQPRDGNPQGSFALWDSEADRVAIIRFEYDLAAAQEAILQAGLPENMSRRLSLGR